MQNLDQVRTMLGISRPEFLRLVGASSGRLTLLTEDIGRVDPIFVVRAGQLLVYYTKWRASVLTDIDQRWEHHIVTGALARLLHLKKERLHQLSHTHFLGPVARRHDKHGKHMTNVYTVSDVAAMFDRSEAWLGAGPRRYQSPLAASFVAHLKRAHPEFLAEEAQSV